MCWTGHLRFGEAGHNLAPLYKQAESSTFSEGPSDVVLRSCLVFSFFRATEFVTVKNIFQTMCALDFANRTRTKRNGFCCGTNFCMLGLFCRTPSGIATFTENITETYIISSRGSKYMQGDLNRIKPASFQFPRYITIFQSC